MTECPVGVNSRDGGPTTEGFRPLEGGQTSGWECELVGGRGSESATEYVDVEQIREIEFRTSFRFCTDLLSKPKKSKL